jgi:hypothetical protein
VLEHGQAGDHGLHVQEHVVVECHLGRENGAYEFLILSVSLDIHYFRFT